MAISEMAIANFTAYEIRWQNKRNSIASSYSKAVFGTKQAVFYEVKRQPKELVPTALETHVNEFLIATRQLKKYSISHLGLSMQDM